MFRIFYAIKQAILSRIFPILQGNNVRVSDVIIPMSVYINFTILQNIAICFVNWNTVPVYIMDPCLQEDTADI